MMTLKINLEDEITKTKFNFQSIQVKDLSFSYDNDKEK